MESTEVYNIKPHRIISQIIASLTFLGLWEKDGQFFIIKWLKKLIYCLICSFFCVALLWGSYLSDNTNESFFLTAAAIAALLHIAKLISVLTKKDQILYFLNDICAHSFSDFVEFNEVQERLNNFAKFGYANIFIAISGIVGFHIVTLPIFSTEVALPISIGFPLDWKKNRVNYWLAHSFVASGILAVTIVYFFTMVYWYIMLNCSIKYKILGNQIRALGQTTPTTETTCKNGVSPMEKNQLLSKCFVHLVRSHRNIQKFLLFILLHHTGNLCVLYFSSISQVKNCFAPLFFTQITTSSICIGCSVYVMAFVSAITLISTNFFYYP